MTTSPSASLLERIESGRFEHAIFLSYSLDVLYFEVAVVRHLVRRGCRNVVVFADSRHVAAELARVADPSALGGRSSWALGRKYSLTPVFHSSAFHPKIALLIGDEIELVIGSGNLEPGGLRSNLEILHRCQCDRDGTDHEARGLVAGVWNYIKHRVARRISSVVRDQLAWVEDSVSWIQREENVAQGAAAYLITGPGADVVQALQQAVGRDAVSSLIVVSPFFDADLSALCRLVTRLRPRRICLIVQPDSVSAPGERLRKMSDVEVYRLAKPTRQYLHAKIVIAECAKRSVLLAGSHNVSELAFGGGNFEAGLLRIATGTRFSSDLDLTQHMKQEYRLDLSTTVLKLHPERRSEANPGNNWLVSAELDGNVVKVVTRRHCSDRSRLLAFARDRLLRPRSRISREGQLLRFQLDNISGSGDWTSIVIEDDGIRSAPAPFFIVEALHRTGAAVLPQFPRQPKPGASLQLDQVADLLQEFGEWLMAEPSRRRSKVVKKETTGQEPAPTAPGKLTYEDFVIPWKPGTQGIGRRSAGQSGLELMVAAIVRAVGGSRGQLAVAEATDGDPGDEDAGLADRTPYGEEALSSGRLEENPEAVRELGFVADAERTILESSERRPVEQRIGSKKDSGEELTPAAMRLRAARRVARRVDAIIDAFPPYLEGRCQDGHVEVQALEAVTAVGRLITALAGRVIREAGEEAELLDWTAWAEFQMAVLDVLTSERTQFLRSLPWSKMRLDVHKRMVEEFAGYLAAVRALACVDGVPDDLRARVLIGVFRGHRILGAHEGKLRPNVVAETAETVLAAMSQELEPPPVAWSEWIELVRKMTKQDMRLRKRFRAGHEIHAAGAGVKEPSVGDWVWWPHTGQHLAVIVALNVAVNERSVVLAVEPGLTQSVLASYVVSLRRES